jgi:hypothetical protein
MGDIEIRPFSTGDIAGVTDVILPIQQKEFGVAITAADIRTSWQFRMSTSPGFHRSASTLPAAFPRMAVDTKFYRCCFTDGSGATRG